MAYTTAAQTGAGGASGAQALSELTIQQINAALTRSLVPASFRLVGVMATAVTEFGEYAAELGRAQSTTDGVMDDVPVRRDALQADLVALVVEGNDSGGSAGRGYLLTSFSKSGHPCRLLDQPARPHVGLSARARDGTQPGAAPRSRQHRRAGPYSGPTATATRSRTPSTRSWPYCCSGCRQIDYYSNPDVLYNGVPTGIADFTDEARALRENFPAVASFRGCPATASLH